MSRIIPSSVVVVLLIALCNGQSQRQTVTLDPSEPANFIIRIRPSQTSTQRRTVTFPSGSQAQTTIINTSTIQTTVTEQSNSRVSRVVNRPLQDIVIQNGRIISGIPAGQQIQTSQDSIIIGSPGQQTIISPSSTLISSSSNDDDNYYD